MSQLPCPRCGQSKPTEEFPPSLGRGVLCRPRQCIACRKEVDAEKGWRYREAHPNRRERYREYDRRRNAQRRERWREDAEYRGRNKQACLRYRVKMRDTLRARARDSARRNREAVIVKYGGRCKCCGETHRECLTIDHPNNDGAADRKNRGGSVALYRWLAKRPVQDGYQLLCANCNTSFAFYGYCPHHNLPPRPPVTGRRRSLEESAAELGLA
jgi:hypothetical protein